MLVSGGMESSVSSIRDYRLYKVKAMQKKKDSCGKDHMKCEIKQGQNLVIEFSTAAFELCKSCLTEILYDKDFEYSVEKKDGIDLQGATVDFCYKVYNTRADGTCGKKLKFVINYYTTTSQILVNGSKVDLFLTDIYDKPCMVMTTKNRELDVININITETLNSLTTAIQPKTKLKQLTNE